MALVSGVEPLFLVRNKRINRRYITTFVFDTRIFRSFYVRPMDVDSRFNVMAWTMGAEAGVEPATTGL